MAQAHGDDGVRVSYRPLARDRATGGESRMGERHEGLSLREAEGVRWGSWSRSDHVRRCHRRPLRNAEPRTLAPERNDVPATLSMVEGVERDAKDGAGTMMSHEAILICPKDGYQGTMKIERGHEPESVKCPACGDILGRRAP